MHMREYKHKDTFLPGFIAIAVATFVLIGISIYGSTDDIVVAVFMYLVLAVMAVITLKIILGIPAKVILYDDGRIEINTLLGKQVITRSDIEAIKNRTTFYVISIKERSFLKSEAYIWLMYMKDSKELIAALKDNL